MSVLYEWTTLSVSGYAGSGLGTVTVTDQAFAAGSATGSVNCSSVPVCLEPSSPVIVHSLLLNGFENGGFGYFYDLTFAGDGTLGGRIAFADGDQGFNVSGSELAWSGAFNSDLAGPCQGGQSIGLPCAITGYWQEVANVNEPFSGTILAAALLLLACVSWIHNRLLSVTQNESPVRDDSRLPVTI